ncbi:helix-turn-helix domain-containing protein [Schaedlerella sp.]|uniref:GH39 family glycosyl hydrolase n=1 Tax=Schaedlerella sp. TaxID=2676057 RepID=UPI003747792D
MRQENIQDCSMELLYLSDEDTHFHQDIEILYIVEGETAVKEGETYRLGKDDIAVINSNQPHAYSSARNTIAFRILIPYRTFRKLIREEYFIFCCNSVLYTSRDDRDLRILIETLLLQYLNMEHADLSEIASLLFQIIHKLTADYRMDRDSLKIYLKEHMSEKIDRILNYINHYYYEPLSLTDVAAHFQVSETYLSRYFKKKTGQNFINYLNEVRIENAALELRGTDASITNIAMDSGFSTPSVLNRYFKKKYGITPSEYRKQIEESVKNDAMKIEKVEEVRKSLYDRIEKRIQDSAVKEVTINVRWGYIPWMNPNKIIDIGEASVVCEAAIQEHILFLREVLSIRYIRIWNLFSEKFMISTDFSGRNFNFESLDRIFDFFVQNKIPLFLDLGKRNRVIMAGHDNELYSVNMQYNLKTIEEWKNLLEHLMKHLVRRYDKHVLSQWIFEFPWNKEPYYSQDYRYLDAYEAGWRIVKSNLGSSKIAGIDPHGGIDEEQFRETVHELSVRGILPEIFTIKIFVDSTHQMMGERTFQSGSDYLYARQFIEKIRGILEEEGQTYQMCISEWSNSLSNRNIVQDSCARGTYIIKFILSIWKTADMIGFWHGSDAVDIFYDSRKLIYGGGGLLTKDGIKKPSFYAFEFLNKLGGHVLKIGNNYIVTRDSTQRIVCLCFNHREYSYYYYMKKENEHFNLSKIFQSEEKELVEFTVEELDDNKEYMIKEEVINSSSGSIQNEWQLLSNQEELGKEEIQYLKNICIPKIYIRHVRSEDRRICLFQNFDAV